MDLPKSLFTLVTIIIFSSYTTPSNAAHSAVSLGCCSHHTAEGDFNEVNPGLGFEYGRFGRFLTAGILRDSGKNLSWYSGGGFRGSLNRYIHGGLFLGIVHRKNRGIIPAVLPSLTIGTQKLGVNLVYVPEIETSKKDKRKTQVLWLQFRLGFDVASLM